MATRDDGYQPLSSLVEAVRQTVNGAQAGIDQEYRAVLRRLVTVDERGEPRVLTWTCAIPGLEGAREIELPLASLLICKKPEITSVEVSFDAEVERRPPAASVVLALPGKKPTAWGRAWSWLRGLLSRRRPAAADESPANTEVWYRFQPSSWWSQLRGKRNTSKVCILLQADRGDVSSEIRIEDGGQPRAPKAMAGK